MAAPACTLLGGPFALLVQLGLAVSAISTLVYKRSTEKPKRPWLIFFFDASKQAFAGMLQHVVNLGFGVLFATSGTASECAWYLTNFSISVACGVVLLWGMMAGYKWLVDKFQLTMLRSGEYGTPPNWKPWLAQMLIWGFLSSFEKLITAIVVILPLHRHLDAFASWLESPIIEYPALELILVMVFAPVLLNMCFFWVVDNMIMRRRVGGHQRTPSFESDIDGKSPHSFDHKQPLLDDDENTCGCIPPFTPTRAAQASSGSGTTTAEKGAATATRRGAGASEALM